MKIPCSNPTTVELRNFFYTFRFLVKNLFMPSHVHVCLMRFFFFNLNPAYLPELKEQGSSNSDQAK